MTKAQSFLSTMPVLFYPLEVLLLPLTLRALDRVASGLWGLKLISRDRRPYGLVLGLIRRGLSQTTSTIHRRLTNYATSVHITLFRHISRLLQTSPAHQKRHQNLHPTFSSKTTSRLRLSHSTTAVQTNPNIGRTSFET